MEQIRIIKELRNADIQRGRTGQFIRPRFMVWENVPGAFSSKKGEDFRVALEETARIAEQNAVIPRPPKNKWRTSGCIMGDGWSIAWRVFDAQFWGVPQRRRRIALVADFGGHAAPEILFVRQSVCGDIAESGTPGEKAAAETGGSTYPAVARSLTARYDGSLCVDRGMNIVVAGFNPQARADAGSIGYANERVPTLDTGSPHAVYVQQNQLGEVRTGPVAGTLNTNSNASGRNAPPVFDARGNGDGKTACTLTGDHQDRVTDYTNIVMETGQANAVLLHEIAPTLNCNHEQPIVAAFGETGIGYWQNGVQTLRAEGENRPSRPSNVVVNVGQVRRLTPLECERLQGYPDGWTDIGPWTDTAGKLHKESSDRARYMALGNSIALPPWAWVLKRLCACYERTATMASLFDGIGGFQLIWERLNGPGSCLWASEIEEFPIAVTKQHFEEEIVTP